jgi:hypothetical protein
LPYFAQPRQDDGQQRTPVQYFEQPNHGGVPTHRLWTPPEELRALRQTWEHTLQELRLS